MIAYNMRYRGAIEYDKMVLSILPYWNELQDLLDEDYSAREFKNELEVIKKLIDDYNTSTTTSMVYLQRCLFNMKEK